MTTQIVLESINLILVDVQANSNKFWNAELRTDGLLVRWGRVGSRGQEKFYAGASYPKYDALKQEKLNKGYDEAQTLRSGNAILEDPSRLRADLKTIVSEQIKTDDTGRQIIDYLMEVNVHTILAGTTLTYQGNGQFTTPLGPVTPSAIAQGRVLLARLKHSDSKERSRLLNQYLRLIPQKLSARIDPDSLLASSQEWEQQTDLLDALASVVPTVQPAQRLFDCSLQLMPSTTEAGRDCFRQIRQRYESTINRSHTSSKYRLHRVYELSIAGMNGRFEANLGNVQPLWHGTKASNLLSILKNGLMIPPASAMQCTGRMFGNGIYFSAQSTKALNYATDFWNRSGSRNQRVFMMLCDVALGREYRPTTTHSCSGLNVAPRGYDSVWVEPHTCNVINHEAVVYRPSQVNLRYLCEFKE